MKKIFDNILLQGWMFDPLDFMEKEEQDEYKLALIDSALTGEVQTDNPKWIRFIEKVLSSIEETRAKYYAKAKKNGEKGKEFGIQGKEYGIQGKEYGKLGGRPRKGESPEEYVIRKKGDCEWTQAFKKIKQDQELIEKIKTNSVSTETIEELSKKYSKDTVIDVMRWIKEKN